MVSLASCIMAQLEQSTSESAASVAPATIARPVPITVVVRHEVKMVPSVASTAPPQVNPWLQYGGPFFTGAAAIIAAVVAGSIAWRGISVARDNVVDQIRSQREVAARVARASVISANRQKWIDGIRDDLAEFLAADSVLIDDFRSDDDDLLEAERAAQRARVKEAKVRIQLMQRRIQLRLNPDKPTHIALFEAVKTVIPATGREHTKARNALIKDAQAFLRHEWLRVKKEAGEWDDAISASAPMVQKSSFFQRVFNRH